MILVRKTKIGLWSMSVIGVLELCLGFSYTRPGAGEGIEQTLNERFD
ncbi:MAG: hypothetical protein ACI92E_002080 [Oceanicoccus sp.]|jgi:hypothetical protein